jgi:hypothetical protein
VDIGRPVDRLIAEADRLDELAETAELMDDPATAARLHAEAARRRERAMTELDRQGPHDPA